MKKLMMMMAMVITMLAFSACGSSNSPSAVADGAMAAVQAGNWEKFVSYFGDKNGDALDPDAQKGMVDLFNSKAKDSDKAIESYKIVSEEISEDGNKATVVCEITKDGKTDTSKLALVKGADGQWRISQNK